MSQAGRSGNGSWLPASVSGGLTTRRHSSSWLIETLRITARPLLVCEDPEDFAESDALARAVRDLAAAGLLRMNGPAVEPTLAAIRFDSFNCV